MPHKPRVDRKNIFLGKNGEQIAKMFLRSRKYKIIEQNLRTPFGEIDLVCLDKKTIVFIEVKTRISKNFGPPMLAIINKKERTIIKNAMYYLKKFRLFDRDARIDVISINLDDNGELERLEHIKSAIWIEER